MIFYELNNMLNCTTASFKSFIVSTRIYCVLVVSFFSLSACVSPPQSKTLVDDAILPEQFTLSGSTTAASSWWLAFSDSTLDSLIEQALLNNFDLRSSFASVQQAKAVRAQAAADQGIWISGEVNGQRDDGNKQYSGSLSASYEVDLWGEISAAVESADYDFRATEEDYRAAALSLSAEVASTWYELIAAEKNLSIREQQLSINQSILTLTQEQFRYGMSTIADSIQQAALVASSRAEIADQRATIDVLKHSLNVLLGRSAERDIPIENIDLPILPTLPATGIPSKVLAQRPDIRSQWMSLQAANADVAEAVANRFPTLSLALSTQSIVGHASDLFHSWTVTLLASLAGDIWTNGYNKAEVAEMKAAVEVALNDYNHMLLEAIQETEDALSNEYFITQRLEHLQTQRDLTYQALEQLQASYRSGSITFTELLTTMNSAQSLDVDVVNVQQLLIENRISLYRALSAGWSLDLVTTKNVK